MSNTARFYTCFFGSYAFMSWSVGAWDKPLVIVVALCIGLFAVRSE